MGESAEEGGFAGIGVADEGEHGEILTLAAGALAGLDFADGFEFFFDADDLLAEVLAFYVE